MYNSGTILHILFTVQGGVEVPFAYVTNKALIEPATKQVQRLFPNLVVQTNEVLGFNYWQHQRMFATLDENQHVLFCGKDEQTFAGYLVDIQKWKNILDQVSIEEDRVGSFTGNVLAALKVLNSKNQKKKDALKGKKILDFLQPVGLSAPSMDEALATFQYMLDYVQNAKLGVKTIPIPQYDINIILFPETVEDWIGKEMFLVEKI